MATLTQSGMRLVHDGQTTGRRTHLPVFLSRFPDEPVDDDLDAFYDRLLGAMQDATWHEGEWQLCTTDPGTIAAQALGIALGCRVLRSHDVAASRRTADTMAAILEAGAQGAQP